MNRPFLMGYVSVLRTPWVLPAVVGTALATLPIGMLGLALLLLVRQRTESFALAGLVVGVFGVGTVVGMVVQGRLVDRFGFRLVLLTASAVRVGSSIAFLVATREASLWPLTVLALLIGMSEPQVSASLRALWPSLVRPELRPAAAALSSVLFELPVLAGPLLLTVLMITVPAEVVILVAAGLSAAGSCTFGWSVAARRWRPTSSRDAGFWGPLAVAKVRAVLVVACAQGVAVGVFQVASAAAAVDLGVPSRAGIFFALVTAGSLVATTLYGAGSVVSAPRWELPALLAALAGALTLSAFVPGAVPLGACAFVFGLAVGPIGVRCFIDLEQVAPAGSPTAATTALIAAGLTATSVGSATAGRMVDEVGTGTPLIATAVCVLAAGLWSWTGQIAAADRKRLSTRVE